MDRTNNNISNNSSSNNNNGKVNRIISSNGKDSNSSKINNTSKTQTNTLKVLVDNNRNSSNSNMLLQFRHLFQSVLLPVDLKQEVLFLNSFQRVRLLSQLNNSQILTKWMRSSQRRVVRKVKERKAELLFNQKLRLKRKLI